MSELQTMVILSSSLRYLRRVDSVKRDMTDDIRMDRGGCVGADAPADSWQPISTSRDALDETMGIQLGQILEGMRRALENAGAHFALTT